jgi:hypothetical protein
MVNVFKFNLNHKNILILTIIYLLKTKGNLQMLRLYHKDQFTDFPHIQRGDNRITGKINLNLLKRKRVYIDIEKVANLKEFVDMTVTESRLEQALDNITREQGLPFEMSSLGQFLRWLFNDINTEEQDTIVANQIDVKMIGKTISNKARPWFIERLNYG